MITVRLFGGLGNQMFQYATGRALARRRGVDLALDTRDTDRLGGHGRLALHRHRIETAPPENLPPDRRTQRLRYAIWRVAGGRIWRERQLGFDKTLLQAPDGAYLHGYFQSERYFADIADDIRAELALVDPLSAASQDALGLIEAQPQATSLHVRRGDYVGTQSHGVCDAHYYSSAVDQITERLGTQPHVFAFSDDPDWVRSNLQVNAPLTVIGHNGPDQGHEDMMLMAACKHHIVANSTFSWWGAWLNASSSKTVVAPARWFADPNLQNPDILPRDWIAL